MLIGFVLGLGCRVLGVGFCGAEVRDLAFGFGVGLCMGSLVVGVFFGHVAGGGVVERVMYSGFYIVNMIEIVIESKTVKNPSGRNLELRKYEKWFETTPPHP